MTPLIIIGSGGHAGVIIDAVAKGKNYKIIGLLDDYLAPGDSAHGHKIIGRVTVTGPKDAMFFIAVGDIRGRFDIWTRMGIIRDRYATIVHPSATIAFSADIYSGVFIGAGANVGPNCVVNEHAIINTHASLDHDSTLGAFSHLAPGVVTGGRVQIDAHTFVGVNASVRDGVKIWNNSTIGMQSAVVKEVSPHVKGWGVPFAAK